MPGSLASAATNSKKAVKDSLTPSRLGDKAPSAVGSAVGSRTGSVVTSSLGSPCKSIEDMDREERFYTSYASEYKPHDVRASMNMGAAGREVMKIQIYGDLVKKRESSGASNLSACTLASKDRVATPPPKALTKISSAPIIRKRAEVLHHLSKPKGLQSLANSSPEDQEGSVSQAQSEWRGATISGYHGSRAPSMPNHVPVDKYGIYHTTYMQNLFDRKKSRMFQGPGRAGNSNVDLTNPLAWDDLETWRQHLEGERQRVEKDRAAIMQQQSHVAEQQSRMKEALGFSGANC